MVIATQDQRSHGYCYAISNCAMCHLFWVVADFVFDVQNVLAIE